MAASGKTPCPVDLSVVDDAALIRELEKRKRLSTLTLNHLYTGYEIEAWGMETVTQLLSQEAERALGKALRSSGAVAVKEPALYTRGEPFHDKAVEYGVSVTYLAPPPTKGSDNG